MQTLATPEPRMQSLRIRIPRICACAENSEYCAFCPRPRCSGIHDCPHCADEIRMLEALCAEFHSTRDYVVRAEILLRKCDLAKDAPAFFAAHPSVRTSVEQLLTQGLGAAQLSSWHIVFREAQDFLCSLARRSDWR